MNSNRIKDCFFCLDKPAYLLATTICICTSATAAELLPSPLTLSAALSFSDSNHPDLSLADAKVANATARQMEAMSNNDIDAYIEIAPFTAYPSVGDEFVNDSYARLAVSKTLYDFGYNDYLEKSANEAVSSQKFIAINSRNQNHIKIMRSFFDVLLADLQYAAINEEMISRYVHFKRLRDRNSLDMISEVELAEAESVYREAADRLKVSELELQSSRQRLAITLNHPDDIPYDLITPELPQLERTVPDIGTLLKSALKNNLMLIASKHAILADQAALKATQHQTGPSLTAGFELNNYARNNAGRNDASIVIKFRVPILNGSKEDAKSARATAELAMSQAKYDLAKYSIRQQLSDLIRHLEILHFKRASSQQRLASAALNMEKSRAIYELEIQSTLGDSMAKYTKAEWLLAKNNFEIVVTWAQIETLTGQKLYQDKDK